jgi:hypothetical protein
MSDATGEPKWSTRDDIAQLGALLNSVLEEGSSVLSSEVIDELRKEEADLPVFALLTDYEQRLWQAFLNYDPPSGNCERSLATVGLGWLTTTFHQTHAAFQLAANGLREVAVANVRAAMEHAFYLSAFVN